MQTWHGQGGKSSAEHVLKQQVSYLVVQGMLNYSFCLLDISLRTPSTFGERCLKKVVHIWTESRIEELKWPEIWKT